MQNINQTTINKPFPCEFVNFVNGIPRLATLQRKQIHNSICCKAYSRGAYNTNTLSSVLWSFVQTNLFLYGMMFGGSGQPTNFRLSSKTLSSQGSRHQHRQPIRGREGQITFQPLSFENCVQNQYSFLQTSIIRLT